MRKQYDTTHSFSDFLLSQHQPVDFIRFTQRTATHNPSRRVSD